MPLVLRNEKGSQLTFNEMDGNFTYLEELSQTGSFTGSFIGDGSGLTNIPGVTPIATGSFATTGSNAFVGNQIISGSTTISGSISQVGIGTNNTIIGRGAGSPTGTGINTLVGVESGRDLTTGFRNTFFGAGAGQLTSVGDSNTYIGQSAGVGNTSGSSNIAVGRFAGARLLDGTTPATQLGNSIFIGNFTESDGDNVSNQIVIGDSAEGGGQNTVTLGNNNIVSTRLKGSVSASLFSGSFVGDGSGLTGIPGVTPIATGSFATTGSNQFNGGQSISGSVTISGSVNATGNSTFGRNSASRQQFIGSIAVGPAFEVGSPLLPNTASFFSIAVGASNKVENYSIAVGELLHSPSGQSNNALFGAFHSASNTGQTIVGIASKIEDTGVGAFVVGNGTDVDNRSNLLVAQGSTVQVTGSLLVTGSANIRGGVTGSSFTGSFVGDGSGLTNIPGATPIATGSFATTGSNQFKAAQTISGSLTVSGSISQVGIGTNNTIVGFEAGRLRTTGMFNTLIGKGAGERATIANSITLVGSNSGNSVTTGNNNTFIGASSGQATTTGDYNVAIGSSALFSNTTGTSNTVIGYSALSQLLAGSSSNIAIGYGAGTLTSDASNLSSSADSIFIGDATYAQNNSQTNQIVIGMYAVGAGSNTTMIGNDNTTATYLKGTLNVTRQILSEVSSSLNFANDTAAAAGGVPLGGLYRNGNAIQIRLV